MLELTIYGLMALAAIVVIAFFFAYGDEFQPARGKSSFDLINKHTLERFSDDRAWDGESIIPGDSW